MDSNVYSQVYVVKLDDFYFTADLLMDELPFHLRVTFDLPRYIKDVIDISSGRYATHLALKETELYEHLVDSSMFENDVYEFIYKLVGAFEAFLLKGYRLRLFFTQHHLSFPNQYVLYVRELDNEHIRNLL